MSEPFVIAVVYAGAWLSFGWGAHFLDRWRRRRRLVEAARALLFEIDAANRRGVHPTVGDRHFINKYAEKLRAALDAAAPSQPDAELAERRGR